MAKELTSIDFANTELAKGLTATLNEKAQGEWFAKAVSMLQAQEISVRGLKATIALAEDSTWLKESHVPYFLKASALRSKEGGDKVALKKVITVVQDAKRAFGKDFDAQLEGAKTFNSFVKSIPARESASRGAGETADEKAISKKVAEIAVDADAVIALASGLMAGLEGDAYFLSKIEDAEKFHAILGLQIKNSKRKNHPVNAEKASA
jgi:hypothetical protein